MAELVDALVSNTSSSNAVGVQFPLRVLKRARVRAGASKSLFFLALPLTITLFVFFDCPDGRAERKKQPGGLF